MDITAPIDVTLVRRLIEAQFPNWADLLVEPVEPGGRDNRTFASATTTVCLPAPRPGVAQFARSALAARSFTYPCRSVPLAVAPAATWPWSV